MALLKKQKSSIIISFVLMYGVTFTATAGNFEVQVKGTIIPTACSPNLSNGGVINYGAIPLSRLSETDYTVLDEKEMNFDINCHAPVRLALKVINARPGSVAGTSETYTGFGVSPVKRLFGRAGVGVAGLGMVGNAKVGGYGMRIYPGSITSDNGTIQAITREGNRLWRKGDAGSLFSTDAPRMDSWANRRSLIPLAVSRVSGKLSVQAYINKASELDLSKEVNMDGVTTLELFYQ